jgi:hypothetical protein
MWKTSVEELVWKGGCGGKKSVGTPIGLDICM